MEETLACLELPLYRFLLSLSRHEECAADLTQETLLRAWKHRHTLRSHSSTKAWLFQIGINVWRDFCRDRATDRLAPTPDVIDLASRDPSPPETAIANELGLAVWNAILQLPERQRQVMHLRWAEQMEPQEIATTLGLDRGLVRSNLAAARKTLRQRLADSALAGASTNPTSRREEEPSR